MFVPSKILKFRSHDKAWFNERCLIMPYKDKNTGYNLRSANRTGSYWENHVAMRNIATNVYQEAKSEYNAHLRDLSEASHPHKWRSTLKASPFGVKSFIPCSMKPDGNVTCSPTEKAEFYLKQNLEDTEFSLSCRPLPCCNSCAFRSSDIRIKRIW